MTLDDQILALYETGAPVDVIARAMEMSEDNIAASLFHTSPNYRRTIKTVAKTDAPPNVATEMLDILTDIARISHNPLVQMSAAKYVRDDLMGRRDAIPIDAGLNLAAFEELKRGFALVEERERKFYQLKNATVTDIS